MNVNIWKYFHSLLFNKTMIELHCVYSERKKLEQIAVHVFRRAYNLEHS